MNLLKIQPNSLYVWIVCIFFIYFFVVRNTTDIDLYVETDEVINVIDSVVYVSMGAMAENNLVDFSIASVKRIGGWDGAIYLLTDRPECFQLAAKNYNVQIVTMPTMKSIIAIKSY